MDSNLASGFIAIHSDRIEHLRDTVFAWLQSNPLPPLDQEIILVQSNGVAEWVKMAMADRMGVCSGVQVALPARFLWQAYRQVLGPRLVPRHSPYDRQPLTWRLMQLLPRLLTQPGFSPLAYFLKDGSFERRLQLAQKLSGLYDQYQVYRANWLQAWTDGEEVLIDASGQQRFLAEDQRWQARLWQAVTQDCAEEVRKSGRADIHRQFVQGLESDDGTLAGKLPPRIVLFGVSALPYQSLEALGAIARHRQVIVAAANPCQYHWGDIISGRGLLRAQRRHQADSPRSGSLAHVPFEQMHAHCNPLLAGWGRLGRDFISMLDEFDDVEATRRRFPQLRVDVFSDGAGTTLLGQVQAAIRQMQPLPGKDVEAPVANPADSSIRFHIAHSAQREVEILHDQLLGMLGAGLGGEHPLQPREVIVMMPDLDKFAPAIHAIFGQYPRGDKRQIPYAVIDVSARRTAPILVALDWLLRLPQQRCLQSEVRDLMDVPAIAARFGITPQDLPRLSQWIDAAGIRWGLDAQHRAALDLAGAGAQNAWLFGMRRMLLGYANGQTGDYDGIEPMGQVGGLDAALAGSLARLIDTLSTWQQELSLLRKPAEWVLHAERLLQAFFKPDEEDDRLTLAQLRTALPGWLVDCDASRFSEPVPVSVLREAWLAPLDEQALHQRFISGGVTFCTLMPMRALPYRVVCLLGMNDGDFPRREQRVDFDLLALPDMAKPGDRSRRDDDRYLMLEAVLSARDRLYISWVGKSVRDNSAQPPSVLVAQLRDYLKAGWKNMDLGSLTVEHFLQPFSRNYFEHDGLHSFADEWRATHDGLSRYTPAALPNFAAEGTPPLPLAELIHFLKQPVKQFFKRRLDVQFLENALNGMDDEPFALNALEAYQIRATLLSDSGPAETLDEVPARMADKLERMQREGRFPIGQAAVKLKHDLIQTLVPVRSAWLKLSQRFPARDEKIRLTLQLPGFALEDWVDQMRNGGSGAVWMSLTASRVMGTENAVVKSKDLRADKLLEAYVRQLALASQGLSVTGYLVASDCLIRFRPIETKDALIRLENVGTLWRRGMDAPLPTACGTALALLSKGVTAACTAYDGPAFAVPGMRPERAEPTLARLWPDYQALAAESSHAEVSQSLYGPLLDWVASSVEPYPLSHVFD